MSTPTALVVVPTYNERANLPVLIDGLLKHPTVRVLVVDDGSPDGTGQLADELATRELLESQRPTTILVSHRFATATMADEILVLDNGAIIERGTHKSLVEAGGRYAELYDLQTQAYR